MSAARPEDYACSHSRRSEDCRLGWQTHLLNEHGVDAEAMVIIEGFNPPRTFEAAKDLLVAGYLHTFWMRVLDSKKDAIAAVVVSKDPYVSMREAVMKAFEELPATFGVIA